MRRRSSLVDGHISTYAIVVFLILPTAIYGTVPSFSDNQNDNDLVFDEISQDLNAADVPNHNAFTLSSQTNKINNETADVTTLSRATTGDVDDNSEDLSLTARVLQRVKRQFFDRWFDTPSTQPDEETSSSPLEPATEETTKALSSSDYTTKDDDDDDGDDGDGDTDDEDKDTTDFVEPAGASEVPSTTSPVERIDITRYFRLIIFVLEPFLDSYSNQRSNEFRVFAYNVTRGLNLVFGSLPERIIPLVVSIQKTNIENFLKVAINLETKGTYTREFIDGELVDYIRQKRSLGDLKATHEGLLVRDLPESYVCNTYELPCDNSPHCYGISQKCDGNYDCPDRSDELECIKAETEEYTTFPNTSSTTPSTTTITTADIPTSTSATSSPSTSSTSGETDVSSEPETEPPYVVPVVETSSDITPEDRCRADDKYPCQDGRVSICKAQKCDGEVNCPNGDDEKDCPRVCTVDEFRCDNDRCLPSSVRCNSFLECSDGTDEQNCPLVECTAGQFQCSDRSCIDSDKQCDGRADCSGAEDEENCQCTAGQFQCPDRSCIDGDKQCDGRADCPGAEDEENCPSRCRPDEFKCDNGQCMNSALRCNFVQDCPNGEDEFGCPPTISVATTPTTAVTTTSTTTTTLLAQCQETEFRCEDGTCIQQSFVCDTVKDCYDGSDEKNCLMSCGVEEFQCESGQCIPYIQRCDRRRDCPDGSDEVECSPITTEPTFTRPPVTLPVTCTSDQFTCRKSHQCIPLAAVCDNVPDCRDYSDEDATECGGQVTEELNLKTYPNDQIIKEEREGGDVVFQCRDEGPIRAPVQWIRGEQLPLPPGSRDNNGRLEIPNIQINHTGVYICKAAGYRSLPRSEVSVYLNVVPYPKSTAPSPRFCGINEATCQNGECIPKQFVCNGRFDCGDRSDEERCSSHGCEPNEFRCSNRRCVQKTWRCDSQNDCGDNSDEQNCEPSPPGSPCRYDEFQCRTGNQCIPKAFHCDAEVDCLDGSDEVGCSQVSIIAPPPHMTTLDEGATFTVTCTAFGVPTPEVIWRLNWGHVPAKCVMTSVNGLGTLECPDVQEADQGAYSCEALNSRGSVFATPDAILIVKRTALPSCPAGTFNDLANTTNDCISCFCFGATTQCKSANLFIYQLPPPITLVKIIHIYFDPTRGTIEFNDKVVSPLQNYVFPLSDGDGFQVLGLIRSDDTYVEHGTASFPYFALPEGFYGNQLKSYGGYIKFTIKYESKGQPVQVPMLILSGNGYKLYHKVPAFYPKQRRDISVRIFSGYWYKELQNKEDVPTYTPETLATREEIMMALANVDHVLIQIQFVDAEQVDTTISNIRIDSAGIANTGQGQAAYVEECSCPAGYSGLSCETCSSGYSRRTQGPWLGQCYKEPQVCHPGTYGDPERGIPCRVCPCPSTSPPNQHGRTCYLDTDGQPTCSCPAGYAGRRCEQCSYGYIGNPLLPGGDCKAAPCDPVGSLSPIPDPATGACNCKDFTTGQYCNQCKPNTFYLASTNVFGCISCFCMGTTNQCRSSNWYREQITSTFTRNSQDFRIAERRALSASSSDFTLNPSETEIIFTKFPTSEQGVYYWILPLKFLHDKVTSYGGYLNYTLRYVPIPGGQLSRNSAPHVQIISASNIELLYFSNETVPANTYYTISVPLFEQYWQRPDGATANREHLLMALADLKMILIKSTYITSTLEVGLQSVSLDIAEERNTGQKRAYEVEECTCPAGHRGLSCQDCDVGYTRVEQGLYLGVCEPCSCNGHSSECHPETGVCLNCANNTMGDKCESCIPGYTGNPTTGEACSLVGSFGCNCDPRGIVSRCVNEQCICKTNVFGPTCARCRPGTFDLHESHPDGCISCYCSGVTDQCSSSNLFITQIPVQLIDQSHGFTLTDSNRQRVIKSDFTLNIRQNQIGYDYTAERGQRLFWSLPPVFTGDQVTSYGGNLTWTQLYITSASSIPSYDTDVVVFGNGISIHWTNDIPLAANISVTQSVPFIEGGWRRLTSSGPQRATRNDIMLVLSAVEAILIRASYASQTSFTYISDVSLDTAISESTGQAQATHVESCRCPVGYKGFSCETCDKGHYRASRYTAVKPECRRCPCNGNEESCSLAPNYQVICNCKPGYAGQYCATPELTAQETVKNSTTPSPVGPSVIYVKISEPLIQIVATGSTVRYRCSAESIYKRPIVSVKWSKDGGELPRDRASDDGRGVLTLRNTDAFDSGSYICTAFDGYTYVSQRTTLTVGEPVAPTIIIYPSTYIEASVGDPLEVTCEVTGLPPPEIEWGRLGTQFVSKTSSLKNLNKLRIESVKQSDDGDYYCRAINSVGSTIKTYTIRVSDVETRFPKDVTKLVVHPTEYTGENGDPVRFECSIISGPGVDVSWSRSGNKPLPPTSTVRQGVLIIYNATPADSGTYICQGLSETGVGIGSSVSVLVNILRPSGYGEPPTLSIQPQNQTVPQGSTVVIQCFCTSDPSIPIEWSKANEPLPSHVQVSGSELRIPSVDIRDRGIYLCKATSEAGPSQVSSHLEVERRELPAITIYPKAVQTVIEGGSAFLQCRVVAGIPTPRITWYRAHNQSFTSRVQITRNEVLRFIGPTQADEGQYICKASNSAGSVESIATLQVNSAPVITLNPSGSVSYFVGQRIHLECLANGKPSPNVGWSRYPPLPQDYKGRPSDETNIAVYEINSAQESDTGLYTCTATNDAGSTEDRVKVEINRNDEGVVEGGVVSYPDPVAVPSTLPDEEFSYPIGATATVRCDTDIPSESIYIQWRKGDSTFLPPEYVIRGGTLTINYVRKIDAGRYTCIGIDTQSGQTVFSRSANIRVIDPPQLTLNPKRQVVRPGDDAFVRCSAVGDEPVTLSWSTQSGASLPYSVQVNRGDLQFRGITIHDAGKYVCRGRNSAGEAEAVAEVIVNERAKPIIPVITARDRSQFAIEGSDLELKCIVDPSVTGYRVNWKRERQSRLPIGSQIVGNTLRLYNLRVDDSDRYVCHISSPLGTSEDYIDLQVDRT